MGDDGRGECISGGRTRVWWKEMGDDGRGWGGRVSGGRTWVIMVGGT